MPDFSYIAVAKNGHKESSTIQAANAAAAGHLLREQGLLLTSISEEHAGAVFGFLKNLSSISLGEKISFIQNLGIMLKAGISVTRSMQILVKQTKHTRFKSILTDISSMVQSGKGLGEALEKYPKVFSNIFVSMIKVGEMSGNLDKSLEYLGIQLQREADLKSKAKGALIYPSVIIGAMVIIGVLMAIFVLPKLTATFEQFGSNLPLSTKIVIAIAHFMGGHAVLVIGGIIVCVVTFVLMYRTYMGQRYFDILILHFFIINNIVKKINLARFARILSSLLKSGIPFVQALEVSSDSISSIPYKELVGKSAVEVKLGKPLTEILTTDNNLFPVLVVQMLQVGEESGTMDAILEQLAVHYEEEVDTLLKNLSSIIEPLLLLVIGGVVGLLAMALISPIYSISQNIQ